MKLSAFQTLMIKSEHGLKKYQIFKTVSDKKINKISLMKMNSNINITVSKTSVWQLDIFTTESTIPLGKDKQKKRNFRFSG